MQNYGFPDGIPGSLYNQGIKAKAAMTDYMATRMQSALQDEQGSRSHLEQNPSIMFKFLKCLAEEGYDIQKDGCTKCATQLLPTSSSCVSVLPLHRTAPSGPSCSDCYLRTTRSSHVLHDWLYGIRLMPLCDCAGRRRSIWPGRW